MTIETKDLTKAEIEFLSDKCEKLENENQQLKELLQECRDDVNHIISNVYLCKELLDLKTKIDNAIGADNDKK